MGFPYNGAEGAENCVLAYIYISSIFEIIDFALAYIYIYMLVHHCRLIAQSTPVDLNAFVYTIYISSGPTAAWKTMISSQV